MTKYVDNVYLVTEECCNCGMAFAITKDFQDRRLNDHKSFYCPAGHPQHYVGKTNEQRLKERLEAERRGRELAERRAEAARRQVAAQKAAKTRVLNRIHNGVCPCCNRTFQNLAKHMATKHPEKIKEPKNAEAILISLLLDKDYTTPQLVEKTGLPYQKVLNTLKASPEVTGVTGRPILWRIAK